MGKTGLRISTMSLGGWLTFGGTVAQERTTELMDAAFKAGINFFDTAEAYAGGECEVMMGNAIKSLGWARKDYVISTKIYWGGDGPNDSGLSRKHVVEGLTNCLTRLQLDYVDIVFAHRPDVHTPLEETVRAFNHVIDKGMAFYWGTSEWSGQQITEAQGIADRLGLIGPSVEQPQYHMLERKKVEADYQFLYDGSHGIGLTTWSPLASGILTGKYANGIPTGSRMDLSERWRGAILQSEKGQAAVAKAKLLAPLAEELGCTLAQLALAWVVKNSHVTSVILGATSVTQLEENLSALRFVDALDTNFVARLEAVLDNKPELQPVYGDR